MGWEILTNYETRTATLRERLLALGLFNKLFYNLCQSIGAQNKYGAILYQTSGAKLHQCYISKSIHARNLIFCLGPILLLISLCCEGF